MTRLVEQELIKKHIPYKIYGGIRFYERKEIKDALAYLRLVEYGDDMSFLRIINTPSRKLGKVFLDNLQTYANIQNISLYEALKQQVDNDEIKKDSAIEFVDLIQEAKNKRYSCSVSDLLEMLLKESSYLDFLRLDEDEDRLQNIEELKLSIKYYEEANVNEDIDLGTFLQDIALYTNTDADMSADAVKLMTIHQSKGLEFPCVFVMQLFDGGLPSYRTVRYRNLVGLEEERRLMYVAITRAENVLYLSESEGYDFSSQSEKYPSRFLREIERALFITKGKMDESLWGETDKLIKEFAAETHFNDNDEPEFMVNDIVGHEIFGYGKILQVNEDGTCKIQFKKSCKTLKNEYVDVIERYEYDVEIDYETGLPIDSLKVSSPNETEEIVKNEINIGDKISHSVYGNGTVLNIYEQKGKRRAEIKFGRTMGTKKILVDYTKIKIKRKSSTT
jgi:DNA helicase-2/ATP-dependent DNA helicase PcrA